MYAFYFLRTARRRNKMYRLNNTRHTHEHIVGLLNLTIVVCGRGAHTRVLPISPFGGCVRYYPRAFIDEGNEKRYIFLLCYLLSSTEHTRTRKGFLLGPHALVYPFYLLHAQVPSRYD